MPEGFSLESRTKIIGVILVAVVIILPSYYVLKPNDESDRTVTGPPGLWFDGNGNTHIEGDANGTTYHGNVNQLSTARLFAGQVNEITLASTGAVVLIIPDEAIILHPESPIHQYQNTSFFPLEKDATFRLMISPTVQNIILEFYGQGSGNFTIMIEPSEDPLISGSDIYDLLEQVTDDADGYNARYVSEGSPQLERGALYFESLFESYGLEAEVQRYWSGNILIINVVAIKWGLDRETFIGVGGHMDVATSTHQGAYDDTSGTVHTLLLAKALADIETKNTYFFGLWSAEEEGIWGSGEFVNNFEDNYPGATIRSYVNLDMVGINYPGTNSDTGEYYPLHGYVGGKRDGGVEAAPGLEAIVNDTAHDFLGYPNSTGLQLGYSSFGSSDHVPFQRAGVPTVFFIGIIYEYSEYHTRDDTLSTMREYMGGREGLEAGFEVTAWMTLGSLLELDHQLVEVST